MRPATLISKHLLLQSFSLPALILAVVFTLAQAGSAFAQDPELETRFPIIPYDSIAATVDAAHAAFADVKDGANANYIPVLDEVPSELFGVSVVTVDGQVAEAGDVDYEFSIQSIAKVFTMALVLEERGADVIFDSIGVDATGRVFNSIEAIEAIDERTVNPLVNAGAISTTSLVPGATPDEKWDKIEAMYNAFAGRELSLNDEVYVSESATNQRNQAIAKLLQAYGRIYDDPEVATDLYTRQGSMNVNAHDLAVMGATLANGGVNPITGEQVMDGGNVGRVFAVMATAGLYDDSGIWLYRVGLPAKSGVGGGIVAVVPRRFGIAAFSPRLDAAGNSVRAQLAIEYIAKTLGVGVFSSVYGSSSE